MATVIQFNDGPPEDDTPPFDYDEPEAGEYHHPSNEPAHHAQGNGSGPSRTLVRLLPGCLHKYAAATEGLIAQEVYVRGGDLVRIGLSPDLANPAGSLHITRDERQAVVLPVSAEHLRRRLTELAQFQVYRRREKDWVDIDCPKDLAANIMGAGDWPQFKSLTAIATAPFIRPDLTICATHGYDAATGVYLRPAQAFPSIPAEPTRTEADEALSALMQAFGEFPFAEPASRAVFAANVLTAAVRVTLGTSPVFFYTAPVPATGKTLLARMPNLIATGTEPAIRPHTDESEEVRKVLYSALLAGDSALLFDNVPNGVKIRSAILCGFTTAASYADRRLGTSDSRGLPNRVVVTITGNNITPCGDLARRSLVCRLDVNAESARGRQFQIPDLMTYVMQRRPTLLTAALTIVRGYIAAGCPHVAKPLESFEAWSRLCRDPLIWLGMADAVESQATETDDEVDALRAAFTALAAVFNGKEFMSRDVCAAVGSAAMEMRATLSAAGCSDADDSAKVGYWLRANRDKVAAGHKLVVRPPSEGTTKWRLRRL
jgi:hypothetical protein